jgi:hypothetical protein
MIPLDKGRKPWAFLQTKFDEKQGRFSPDGRWVAYQSNESGRQEVYIRPFADPASGVRTDTLSPQWQVSVAGGLFPAWRHDGRELYWVGPDGRMMAATIKITGETLQPGKPVALFPTRISGCEYGRTAIRGSLGWALSDQHGAGQRGYSHHAPSKLEGEVIPQAGGRRWKTSSRSVSGCCSPLSSTTFVAKPGLARARSRRPPGDFENPSSGYPPWADN